jgi:hypothetical protein
MNKKKRIIHYSKKDYEYLSFLYKYMTELKILTKIYIQNKKGQTAFFTH